MPKDIRIHKIFYVPKTFHPSIDVLKKEYHYLVQIDKIQPPFNRFYSWHYPFQLDIEAMQEGAKLLIGKKDFIAFQNNKHPANTTVGEIGEILIKKDDFIHFTLIGNSFLYKMVRNIVGKLVYIGQGKLKLSMLESIIASGLRKNAGICAPAHGLTLKRVFYDFT